MSLLDRLLAAVSVDAPVRSLLVGAHWTAVCSRGCGLAATMMPGGPHGHGVVREVGRLHRKSARELAEFARSDNLLEASIGVAALNSLLEVDERAVEDINAAQVLVDRGRGKGVALVGRFPFLPDLRRAASRLWVLEQSPLGDELPAEAAADVLPQAEVVAITGTALINHTLDDLLRLCRQEALVMVLGPSTPLSPVLFDHGVSILSGVIVVDEAAALRTISQGATLPQVDGVRLVTWIAAGVRGSRLARGGGWTWDRR